MLNLFCFFKKVSIKNICLKNDIKLNDYNRYTGTTIPVTGDPERDAYSYLGPTYCPLSFKHLDEFNYP